MQYSFLFLSVLKSKAPFSSLAAPSSSRSGQVLHKRVDIDVTATKPDPYDFTKDTYQLAYHKKCSSDQVETLKIAVAEAGYLANALRLWVPKGAYQNSLDYYMGTGTSGDQQTQIQDNINREWALHTNAVTVKSSVNVYCDESVFQDGRSSCVGNLGAYSWSEELTDGTWRHGVVMCPRFFDSASTPTVAGRIKETRNSPDRARSMAALYHTTGQDWFHETMHFESTVTQPRALDADPAGGPKIYGPQAVHDTANSKGAGVTAMLADAYTMSAVSNMLMQTFGISQVPVPYKLSWTADYIDPLTASPPLLDAADALPSDDIQASAGTWTQFSASEANIKPEDYLPMPVTYPLCTDPTDKKCNYISSCGDKAYWMPIEDFTGPTQSFDGYRTAVSNFCRKASGSVVAPGQRLTDIWGVGMDQGGDPAKKGKPGYLNFEINNKFTDTHYVSGSNCVNVLMALADETSDCYGPNNKDCKGGSYQIGKDAVSYHALGSWNKASTLSVDNMLISDQAQVDPDAVDDSSIWIIRKS